MKKKFLLVSLFALGFLPSIIFAQNQAGVGSDPLGVGASFEKVKTIQGSAGVKDISPRAAIVSITAMVAALAGVLAVLAIIIGGVYYIASFGDEGRAKTGKKVILYAVIGLAIIGFAAILVNAVVRFFVAPPA